MEILRRKATPCEEVDIFKSDRSHCGWVIKYLNGSDRRYLCALSSLIKTRRGENQLKVATRC